MTNKEPRAAPVPHTTKPRQEEHGGASSCRGTPHAEPRRHKPTGVRDLSHAYHQPPTLCRHHGQHPSRRAGGLFASGSRSGPFPDHRRTAWLRSRRSGWPSGQCAVYHQQTKNLLAAFAHPAAATHAAHLVRPESLPLTARRGREGDDASAARKQVPTWANARTHHHSHQSGRSHCPQSRLTCRDPVIPGRRRAMYRRGPADPPQAWTSRRHRTGRSPSDPGTDRRSPALGSRSGSRAACGT